MTTESEICGFDTDRFDFFWEDPNYRPNLANKTGIAELFDTSLKTVDDWVRKGAPVHKKGNRFESYEISTAHISEWLVARSEGISILEYRRREKAELKRWKKRHPDIDKMIDEILPL